MNEERKLCEITRIKDGDFAYLGEEERNNILGRGTKRRIGMTTELNERIPFCSHLTH